MLAQRRRDLLALDVPQRAQIQQLVVQGFLGDSGADAAEAAGGAGVGAEAPVAVHAHLPGAGGAGRVVADEQGVVVARGVGADGVLELGDEGDGGEGPCAQRGRADDAVRRDVRQGRDQAFEEEGMVAETAAEREAAAVLEADRIGDLAFEREDFVGLRAR